MKNKVIGNSVTLPFQEAGVERRVENYRLWRESDEYRAKGTESKWIKQ